MAKAGNLYFAEFADVSVGEANRLAASLVDLLGKHAPEADVGRHRADPGAQDLGSLVGIVLDSAAVTAIAAGIAAFLKAHTSVAIRFRDKDGTTGDVRLSGRLEPDHIAAALNRIRRRGGQ